MLILVTEKGFVWQAPDGKNEVAAILWGPKRCRHEEMELVRGDKVVDTCTVEHIGTHASYDGFSGFSNIFGHHSYTETLRKNHFQVGDQLRINDLPPGISEEAYWSEMTLDKATAA